jgi:DNA-binding CsgD family transcriptional regulator
MTARTRCGDAIGGRWGAELAYRAREATTLEQFRGEVLAICREVAAYDCAVLTEYQRHQPVATVNVGGEALELIRYCEGNLPRYAADLHKCFAATRRSGGMVDVDVYSSRERRELALFREIVRPQGIRSTVALTPRWRGVMRGMIRLERHGLGSPFTERDLRNAIALLPIIELGLAAHDPVCRRGDAVEVDRLSAREVEVARHVARGLTNSQVALLLGTSPFTVRNQLARIFDRLGVFTRAELAARLSPRVPHGTDVPFRAARTHS